MGMVIIPIILTLFVVFGIISILGNVPFVSKTIFAVFAAIVVHNDYPFGSGGFKSYVIWLAIISAVCLILCLAPRMNRSFLFLCNTLITHIASGIVISICCSLFMHNQKPELYVEMIIKAICLFGSIVALSGQSELTKEIRGTNIRLLVIVERVIASFVYALALLFLFGISFNNHYKLSLAVGILIFGVSFVLAYIFDNTLFKEAKPSRTVKVQSTPTELEQKAWDEWVEEMAKQDDLLAEKEHKSVLDKIDAWFDRRQDIEDYLSAEESKWEKEKEDRWHREWMDQDY